VIPALAAVVILAAAPSPAPPNAPLAALFREAWEFRLREDPLLATSVGDHRFDDRLPSMAREDLERRDRYWRAALDRLRAIDPGPLSPADRINRDMFERELRDAIAEHEFGAWRMPWNADSGFHTALAQLPSLVPLATVRDYENYVARLRAMPVFVRQQIVLLREGLRAGFTLPRVVLEGYDATIRAHVVDDPDQSVFAAPFRSFPAGVSEAERERLRAAGRSAIREGAIAAYGVSVEKVEEALTAIARPHVASVQIILNAFRLKPLDAVLPAARAAAEFSELARDAAPEATAAQVALAWVATQDGVSSVIPGARNPEQARANAVAGSLELPFGFDAVVRELYDREIRSQVHGRW